MFSRFLVLLVGLPSNLLAQTLPEVTLPGDNQSGDIFGTFVTLAVVSGQAVLVILGVVSITGVGWQIVTAFLQARDKNEWGRFGITFVVGGMVLLFVAGTAQLAWSYLDTLQQIA